MLQKTNKELLRLQEEWLEQCDAGKLASIYPLSRPFSFGVTQHYIESDCRIMVIGQEAKDYGSYTSDWPLPAIQQFTVDYTDRQLGYRKTDNKYNRSPFWKLFRSLDQLGLAPAWNNVDKFHQIKDTKTTPLSLEVERQLNIPYGDDNLTLLQREIEVAQPTAILFVTGPYYHETMARSLGIADERITKQSPSSDCECRNITNICGIGLPVFWSYHPAYLQRKHKLKDTVESLANEVILLKRE